VHSLQTEANAGKSSPQVSFRETPDSQKRTSNEKLTRRVSFRETPDLYIVERYISTEDRKIAEKKALVSSWMESIQRINSSDSLSDQITNLLLPQEEMKEDNDELSNATDASIATRKSENSGVIDIMEKSFDQSAGAIILYDQHYDQLEGESNFK
jgi:long-subunit acyl-CoA synthetase (AMP-forming)